MNELLVVEDSGDVRLDRPGSKGRHSIGQSAATAKLVSAAWTPDGDTVVLAESTGGIEGRLAFHSVATGERSTVEHGFVSFYLSPSPDGSRVAHLSTGPLGLELGVVDLGTGAGRLVERGQPLYWSWRPDSGGLAVHVGDTVVLHDLDGGREVLTTAAGRFLVPVWGWDGSVTYGMDDELVVRAADGTMATILAGVAPLRFAADPDNRRIAFADPDDEGQVGLAVLDVLTGRRDVVLDEPTAGFFWSPDGRYLAALVAGDGAGSVRWAVWDGDGTDRLTSFVPGSSWSREVLPFFEQYALSHSVWSADGSALVATGRPGGGPVEVLVQPVGPGTAAPATPRGPGRLAWWRPRSADGEAPDG